MRGSEPPLCYAHGVLEGQDGAREGTGRTLRLHDRGAGEPGELRAREGVVVDGSLAFYEAFYEEEETAALMAMEEATSLAAEVATARVMVRRLLAYLTTEEAVPAEVLLRFAAMIFKGTGTVAQLVRAEEKEGALGEQETFAAARNQALDELAKEWGLDR